MPPWSNFEPFIVSGLALGGVYALSGVGLIVLYRATGVLAGAIHYLYSINFPTRDSITLLAVTLMGGVFSLWGAVVAALLYQFLPALLNNWGVSADWLIILFGVGVLQVLTTAPAGLADQVPRDLARLGRFLRGRLRGRRAAPTRDGAP